MRKTNQAEGLVLLLIAGGVVAVLIGRLLSGSQVPTLEPLLGLAAVPLAVVAVLVGCLVAARAVATRRALRSRVAVAVVPADAFDPSLEAVLLLAAQLSRVRHGVRSWLDKPASAVRIKLATNREGRFAYMLEAPARSASLVQAAVRGLEGVELRDPAEALGDAREGHPRVLRAELVLARPSVEPLERLALDPDPLSALAAAVKPLRCDLGERAVVCVDLLPAAPGEGRRLRRRLLHQARRGQPGGLLDQLRGSAAGQRRARAEPADLAERRADTRALDAKLKDAGALFHLQLLIRCQATEPARAKAALRALLAGFDQLAGRNWLRPAGLRIPGLAFLGSDLPLRRRWVDHRLATGLFRPARPGVVTAREMAFCLKPPTVHCHAENVLRSGALVAAAPPLPALDGREGLIPLGRIVTEHGERLAGVRIADTFFSYVAGRSRYGKTELAIAQFVHLARSGHGGLFLDPHEDALVRIRGYLDQPGVRERVVEINLARPSHRPGPAWNLFELTGSDAGEAERKVEAVVDAFASALGWDERNTRALTLTTQAAQALAAIGRALPAELTPTIFQLPTLLSDDQWRAAALPFLPQASRRFWSDRFPRLSDEAITPVTNLIDRLRASTQITTLFGQSRSTYRIREAMDHGLIVLACPGSGGTRDRLVANLLVFDLLHAAKTRAELSPERRRAFWVFLDEVQSYDGAASGNLAALLEQTGKYGIRAFLLNQNPERLTAATLNAVTTNRSHLLATALNARAAGLIAKEWAGQPDPAALTRLPRYRFLAQVTHHGELTKPFQVHGVPADELLAHTEHWVNAEPAGATAPQPGLAASDALAHLETLDARIVDALTKTRRQQARDEGSAATPAEPARVGGFDVGGGEGERA